MNTASRLLHVGLAVTALVALAPLLDVMAVGALAGHVREAYPTWSESSVSADTYAIAGYLGLFGLLGVAGWAWTIRLAARHSPRTRVVATVLFVLGTITALTNLTYGGTAYETIVPVAHGLLGLLPVLVGAAAVTHLWRRS